MTPSYVARLIHLVDTHTRKSYLLTYFANNIRDVQPLLRVIAKEPYKRDDVLQKRPIILRSLLIVATPYLANNIRDVQLLLRVIAKEPYKRDDVLPKRPIILRSLCCVSLAISLHSGMCVAVCCSVLQCVAV